MSGASSALRLLDMPGAVDQAPRSVVDQVSDSILGLILSNELKPGDPVAIERLGELLGVSHVPIREALRRLEGRGLIRFRRGRRPQIAPVDDAAFDDVFQLRGLLEGQASLRGAAATAEEVAELRETLDDFERLLVRGGALELYSAHERFHLLMLPRATEWEKRFLRQLWVASEQYIQLYLNAENEQRSRTTVVAAHRILLAAVEEGDPRAVHAAVVRHVEMSHETLADAVHAAAATRTAPLNQGRA